MSSNWELFYGSGYRTDSHSDHGPRLRARQASAAGYAEYHPIASNVTIQGRAQNRRVDIVILNEPSFTDRLGHSWEPDTAASNGRQSGKPVSESALNGPLSLNESSLIGSSYGIFPVDYPAFPAKVPLWVPMISEVQLRLWRLSRQQ